MKRTIGLAALAVMLACGTASAQQVNVKIGVLSDMSSLYADIGGPGSVAAAKMAIADFTKDHPNVKVEMVSGDHQNKPDVGSQIANQWFDVAAFSNPTAGQFGTVGRNILIGPGVWNLDFSAIKNFPIREGQSLQLRVETFNTPNHPALGSPGTNWGGNSLKPATNFGQIRDTVTGGTFFTPGTAYQMRQLQFALKYIF